ncbi:hypothetical protein YC2023_006656 [Brassica napus]
MDFTSREVTLRDLRITYETSLYNPKNSLLRTGLLLFHAMMATTTEMLQS